MSEGYRSVWGGVGKRWLTFRSSAMFSLVRMGPPGWLASEDGSPMETSFVDDVDTSRGTEDDDGATMVVVVVGGGAIVIVVATAAAVIVAAPVAMSAALAVAVVGAL